MFWGDLRGRRGTSIALPFSVGVLGSDMQSCPRSKQRVSSLAASIMFALTVVSGCSRTTKRRDINFARQ